MGKPMGLYPIPITCSQIPKRSQDPMISASSFALSSIGCQSPKIGQLEQGSHKTWSRANKFHHTHRNNRLNLSKTNDDPQVPNHFEICEAPTSHNIFLQYANIKAPLKATYQ
jgi:hypothetical protein